MNTRQSSQKCVCGSDEVVLMQEGRLYYPMCDSCVREIHRGFATERLALLAWEASLEEDNKSGSAGATCCSPRVPMTMHREE